MKHTPLLAVLLICLVACGPSVTLDGYDEAVWKQDVNGCNGTRLSMKEVFQSQKDKIKGMDETQIKALLGKPDSQELYVRSQKFFIYYLEPSGSCKNGQTEPLTLKIRFNALGYTNEVFLENL